MNPFAYLALGVAVGAFSGLVGVGGGILIVPALIYFFGFSQHLAQGTSIAVLVPPIGLLAAYAYWKNGYVDLRVAGIICLGFLLGSPFGAKLAVSLPKEALRRVFGALLLFIGGRMLVGK